MKKNNFFKILNGFGKFTAKVEEISVNIKIH